MVSTLYHVTYDGRLQGIEDEGLRPGRPPAIGGASYEAHRQGAIFLTEESGVPYWYARAEQWAHHSSDNALEDGLIPVVLRVRLRRKCEVDGLGTKDAGHEAYKCFETIPPKRIQVWNGEAWSDDLEVEPSLAVDDEGFFLQDWENPLLPSLRRENLKRRLLSLA